MKIPAAVLVLIGLAGPLLGAAEYERFELWELVCRADAVVTGTIRSVDPEILREPPRIGHDSDDQREFTIEVDESVAGSPLTGVQSIHCFSNWTCAARWTPYDKDQRVLLFLSRPRPGEKAWRILGAGGEGEMPLVRDSACLRGYRVHGYPYDVHTIERGAVEGTTVSLEGLASAARGFRDTYAWNLDERGCFVAAVRARDSLAKAKAYADTSMLARHLHEEAVSSRRWTGEAEKSAVREIQGALTRIDGPTEASSGDSKLEPDDEFAALLEALHGGTETRCAFVGDLDGDGTPDLAVGVPSAHFMARSNGAVWILFLDPLAVVRRTLRIRDRKSQRPECTSEFAKFGMGLSGVGDLDRNGVPDLVAGAPGWEGPGHRRGGVWILLLATDGSVNSAVEIGSDPLLQAAGVAPDSGLGSSIARIGDIDGDGFSEIAIGQDPGYPRERTAGRAVSIVSLGLGGAVRWARQVPDRLDGSAPSLGGFGDSLAGPGDVDGDGVPDLAISNPCDSDGGMARGAVWLVLLRPDGSTKGARKISDWAGGLRNRLHNGSAFGSALCGPGDVDGDGIRDLLVGSREGLWTLCLTPEGTVRSNVLTRNPAVDDKSWAPSFPTAIASAQENNGDRGIRLVIASEIAGGQESRTQALWHALLAPDGGLVKNPK